MVPGASQVGKSTLINALFCIGRTNVGRAASVGGGGLPVTQEYRRYWTHNRSLCLIDSKGVEAGKGYQLIRDYCALLRRRNDDQLRACILIANERKTPVFDPGSGYTSIYHLAKRRAGIVVIVTECYSPDLGQEADRVGEYYGRLRAQFGRGVRIVRVNATPIEFHVPRQGLVRIGPHGLPEAARGIVDATRGGNEIRDPPAWRMIDGELGRIYGEALQVSHICAGRLGMTGAFTPDWFRVEANASEAWTTVVRDTLRLFNFPNGDGLAPIYFARIKAKVGAIASWAEGLGRRVAEFIPLIGWLSCAIRSEVRTSDALIEFGDEWCNVLLDVCLLTGEQTPETMLQHLNAKVERWGVIPEIPDEPL